LTYLIRVPQLSCNLKPKIFMSQ